LLVYINLMEIKFDDHLYPVPKNLPLTKDERTSIGERAFEEWLFGNNRAKLAAVAVIILVGLVSMLAGWLLTKFAGWNDFAAYSVPMVLMIPLFIATIRLGLPFGYYASLRRGLLRYGLNACPRDGTKLVRENERFDVCSSCGRKWERPDSRIVHFEA
jgi:hypothetical protein